MGSLNCNSFILFFILLYSSIIASEEVQIDSIKSTEGAGIKCSSSTKGTLLLEVMGEIGKRTITVKQKNKYMLISDKNIYYSTPIHENPQNIIDTLVLSRNMYFENGKPMKGTAGIDEYKNSMESYNTIKSALNEAHEKGKCLNWKL